MKTTPLRARSGSGARAGGPGVGPAGDAHDRVVAEALPDRAACGSRPDAERLRRSLGPRWSLEPSARSSAEETA
jgi:hypothetical protein